MRKGAGFTLIEMLVGIVIIAILATILFPVFAQARSSARTATAITDFKQRGLAYQMYAQDYDGAFPRPQTTLRTAGFKPGAKRQPMLTDTCSLIDTSNPNWQIQNGGCQDMLSGLVWSRTGDEATGIYNRVYTREPLDPTTTVRGGAKEYCRDLTEGGYNDWRLPTKEEVVLAASHQIGSYVSMEFPNGWTRWAGPEFYRGRDLMAYLTVLGTGEVRLTTALDKRGRTYSGGDAICVRTP